jgi:N-methylhydantoinase A
MLASYVGRTIGSQDLITYDGGGTTATQSLIEHGEPIYDPSLSVGYDIYACTPTISIKSIGQGGGAIASVDKGGALTVGPKSAGGRPGPACYGLGGTEPTITDALVLLGILDPTLDWILNQKWDLEAARTAITSKIADFYGWDLTEAAHAIYSIGVHNVALLFREEVLMRGRDPRDFALFVMGGSGPMLAPVIAREQEISTVIIPGSLGTASALGCLLSDIKFDYMQSYLRMTDKIDYEGLNRILQNMEKASLADLARDRITERPEFQRHVDLRYSGQHWEVTVPIKSTGQVTMDDLKEAIKAFDQEHDRLYGFKRPDEPTEIVTLYLRATVRTPKRIPKRTLDADTGKTIELCNTPRPVSKREVCFDIKKGSELAEIYDYEKLLSGTTLSGPAIVHKRDGTIPIFPKDVCKIDEYGNCIITIGR